MKLRIAESKYLMESTSLDFNYLLDQFEYPDYNKYKNKDILYHNTGTKNVYSISKQGLKIDKSTQLEFSGYMIWCESTPGLTGYGGCTVAFKNQPNNKKFERVNNTQYCIYQDIPLKDILFIDTWISDYTSLKRVSDMKRLIDKMGIDKLRSILYKKQDSGVSFFYDIDYLLEKASKQ
jgi:hypothetical protein